MSVNLVSSSKAPLNIAVVGTGISGMAAAWLLAKNHRVTVYEKDDRPGGHTNTIEVESHGSIPASTTTAAGGAAATSPSITTSETDFTAVGWTRA